MSNKEKWNKDNTVLVSSNTGFLFSGCHKDGYTIVHPYKGKTIFDRILREISFKFKILSKFWYNKKILSHKPKYILVWDTLITVDYLKWLQRNNPNAQINFIYYNMVGKAKHLFPSQIPDGIRVWTYDIYDSERYNINLFHSYMYFDCYKIPHKNDDYDVFFVGRDKGRGEFLLDLEQKLNDLGLKTKFIITADGRLSKKKDYYSKPIPYEEVVDYVSRSKAVLNIVMENQHGVTLRDIESIFIKTKLITTNKHIVDADLYDENNVFILDENNLSKIVDFLNRPYKEINREILEKHTIAGMIEEITSKDITF